MTDPRKPSAAPPGTLEKLELMQQRYLAGIALNQPGDATHDNCGDGPWTELFRESASSAQPRQEAVYHTDYDEDE